MASAQWMSSTTASPAPVSAPVRNRASAPSSACRSVSGAIAALRPVRSPSSEAIAVASSAGALAMSCLSASRRTAGDASVAVPSLDSSSSTTGRRGTWAESARQDSRRTRKPSSSTSAANPPARVDLPIPASPESRTIAGCPARAPCSAWSSSRRSSSCALRAVRGGLGPGTGLALPSARQTCTFWAKPFNSASGRGEKPTDGEASERVASSTTTLPGSAMPCRRAARLITGPTICGSPVPSPSG